MDIVANKRRTKRAKRGALFISICWRIAVGSVEAGGSRAGNVHGAEIVAQIGLADDEQTRHLANLV